MWKYLDSLIYWRMKLKPKITAIIRGVRTTTDFEYELQLAALNRLLTDGVDSLFSLQQKNGRLCLPRLYEKFTCIMAM